MGYALFCGLWVWRRRTNRRPCCLPMSNPSTSSWTARPDGSGRWDNQMTAQHLPRDLVRPSSGQQQLVQTTKKKRYLEYYIKAWQTKLETQKVITANEYKHHMQSLLTMIMFACGTSHRALCVQCKMFSCSCCKGTGSSPAVVCWWTNTASYFSLVFCCTTWYP